MLWLMQHGAAEEKAADPSRPLTLQGRADVVAVAAELAWLGVHPDAILHSGKLRAQQTAEIVADMLELRAEPADGLLPDDDVEPWAQQLKSAQSDVMLVGHLPFLSRLAGRLAYGDAEEMVVRFTPGCVVRLDADGGWRVSWTLTPAMAEAMGDLAHAPRP